MVHVPADTRRCDNPLPNPGFLGRKEAAVEKRNTCSHP